MTMLPNGRKATTKRDLRIPQVETKPATTAEPLTARLAESLGINGDKDCGYQFAQHVDGDLRFVAWFRAMYPSVASREQIPEGFAKAFGDGCIARHAELQTPVTYVREGEDSFRKAAEGETIPEGKGYTLSVEFCCEPHMSTHAFGKLAPNLKRLVKDVRDRAKNYKDVRYGRFVKALFTEESKTRAGNKTWREWLDKMLVDALAKAKRATERGDTTAPNPDALRVHIEAFRNALAA